MMHTPKQRMSGYSEAHHDRALSRLSADLRKCAPPASGPYRYTVNGRSSQHLMDGSTALSLAELDVAEDGVEISIENTATQETVHIRRLADLFWAVGEGFFRHGQPAAAESNQ